MTTARAALMAKIKKCLALAQSANEHEAALALEKARALMIEHGISAEDLQLADLDGVEVKGSTARTPARWESVLAAAIARALSCRAVHLVDYDSQRFAWACRWEFVGAGAAPAIAAYAFAVLYRQLRRQRQTYIDSALRRCKPARKRQRADIFCEAWASAVFEKVEALKPTPAPAELIGRWLSARGGMVSDLQSRAAFTGTISGAQAGDYFNGLAAGRRADLNAGVGATAGPALLGEGARF